MATGATGSASAGAATGDGELGPLGVLGHVGDQRDGDVRAPGHVRHPHLPVAVPHAVLHGADALVADAIGRPGRHRDRRALGRQQVRQVLQADARARVAVAGGAGIVERARAAEEHRLAQGVGLLLLRVLERRLDRQALGFRCDVEHELLHVRPAAALGEGALGGFGDRDALKRLAAPADAGVHVHHAARVLEPARHLGEGPVDDAGTEAEVAALQRRVLRPGGRSPQHLARIRGQIAGVGEGVGQHLLVEFQIVGLGGGCAEHHGTARHDPDRALGCEHRFLPTGPHRGGPALLSDRRCVPPRGAERGS